MNTCRAIKRDLARLAPLGAGELPARVGEHLAACRVCRRRLEAARLARYATRVPVEAAPPPPDFSLRVAAALASTGAAARPEADPWRPAWGLIPAFAAMLAGLFILYQVSEAPESTGFLPMENLSAGEHLVLGASAPGLDLVLAAVMEREAR
jgi:hypothetical protein